MRTKDRVLVVGVYLLDHENRAEDITRELSSAHNWDVEQSWAALGKGKVPERLSAITALVSQASIPKFTLLNRLLAERPLQDYQFILVVDDDIGLPPNFLDNYLNIVSRCDFALAQPARTRDSFIDHPFVSQMPGIDARETLFVEIGPLFSIRRPAFSCLLPFDDESGMGWGYDFVWPVLLQQRALRLGIVDKFPIAHDLRKPVTHYRHSDSDRQMQDFLSQREHLAPGDAFTIIRTYATPKSPPLL
ncbi:hypothetical protein [Methylotetracoccus oryzae]|uniref:hypothetical protein n=1 Tax=Methylotetracoccus oryzae TaxID=1919059 RepID=UPI00111B57DE|nr:hypothetical protein [Methylotetracoccus oryzae]